MPSPLFVGIDVSCKDNKVQLLHSDGAEITRFSVPNNHPGAKSLSEKITGVMGKNKFDSLVIGLEATSVYGHPLVYFLRQEPSIKALNPRIHVLNPKQVANFKKAYPELPKNDWVDAWVIADNLRFGRITKEVCMDEKFDALQKLTRERYHVAKNLTREKNRFLSNLFLKFSALAQEDIFSDKFGATSIAIIEDFFSVDDIAYMDVDILAEFLNKKSKGHFADPHELAETIKKAARSSYRLPKTVNDSVNQVLAVSLVAIKALKKQLETLDKAIETQFALIPNTLQSIKGVGPVYAAGIVAEIGDIKRFPNHAALAKFAGLAWSEHQSGQFKAENTHMIRSGNRYLKYYLLEAANKVRVHDPEFKRFYELKYARTPKTPHKRALALTARKFVRLVYALLHSNRLYTPPKGE